MKKSLITTQNQLNELYDHSALTFVGIAETQDNFDFLENWLKEHNALLKELEIYIIKGKIMNKFYKLEGDNAYSEELTILSINPDCINSHNIALARFELEGRWFDDIVENNKRR